MHRPMADPTASRELTHQRCCASNGVSEWADDHAGQARGAHISPASAAPNRNRIRPLQRLLDGT